MSATGDALGFVTEILVVLSIITVGIFGFRMFNKASRVASENINETTVEYQNRDISNLATTTHTGLAVKKYIAKYSRNMRVSLSTLKSTAAHAMPAEYTSTTSYGEVNDPDSLYYVEANSMFTCTVDKDSNGNYAYLVFSQVGVEDSQVDTAISTDAEAKSALIRRLGLSSHSSWDDIYNVVDSSIDSDDGAKHSLVTALGVGSVSSSSSWSDVSAATISLLNSYRDTLTTNKIAMHNKYACMLAYHESATLTFTPDIVTVSKSSGGSDAATVNCWVKNVGWVNGDPGIIVDGNKIVNNNSTNISDTASIVAYN